MSSAEISIIPEFLITLERLGIREDFKVTKRRIINQRTGSFIHFSGIKTSSGDQTATLKSIAGITTWVIEEGEDFKDEKAFNDIDDSIRTQGIQNRVIWIQNPTTREHFIYKLAIKPSSRKRLIRGFEVTVSNVPEWEHIHTTYHIAQELGYLNQAWIEKAEKHLQAIVDKVADLRAQYQGSGKDRELEAAVYNAYHSSHYYYNYIGGWLERAEGVIFDNWRELTFDDSLPYCYGQDYGYHPDPLAITKVAVNQKAKRIHLKQMAYHTMVNDVPSLYKLIGIRKRELIVSDTNENRTTAKIKKAGYNIVLAAKGPNSVMEDIREMKEYEILVDPDSEDLKTELNNYVWNDKKSSVPIDDFNHLIDGARYGFRRLVRKRKSSARRRN